MTTKHTPGPWKLRLGTGVQYDYIIETKAGALVAAYPHYSGATKKATKANARLIAAAPEMLEALQRLYKDFPYVNQANGGMQARAAIAKAIGALK
jgi:hypothetical protein